MSWRLLTGTAAYRAAIMNRPIYSRAIEERTITKTSRSNFNVLVHIRGLPGKSDELRQRLHELITLTRAEWGCISCEMIENGSDATEYTLLQEWSNENAHDAHFSAHSIRNAIQFLPLLLSKQLDIRKFVLRPNAVRYGTNSYGLSLS